MLFISSCPKLTPCVSAVAGPSAQAGQPTAGQVIQEQAQGKAASLSRRETAVFSTAEILSSVEVGQMGQKYSSETVNVAEIAAAGGLTEEKRKEITKNLLEKHTLECAQLENELRSNEIKMITDVISEYEQKKEKALAGLQVRQCVRSVLSVCPWPVVGLCVDL